MLPLIINIDCWMQYPWWDDVMRGFLRLPASLWPECPAQTDPTI